MASNQARGFLKKDLLLDDRAGCVGIPARWAHQNSSAGTVSNAQPARPRRQLPVRVISNGAKEAARAAPPMIDVT